MSTLPACHGLIAAWRLRPAAPPESLSAESVAAALAAGEGGVWLHFDLVDARARQFITAIPGLPAAARAALVEAEESTRLDCQDGALFGCLPDIHYDAAEAGPPPIGLLHVALTAEMLVTARRHPLRGVHAALQGPAAGTPPEALALALHAAQIEFARIIAAQAQQLARIEDQLLRPGEDPPRDALANLRREALRLTRHLHPLAEALEDILEEAPPALATPLAREARRAQATMRALAAIREGGRIAQDQAAAHAAEETNRRLLVLSVLSAAILPATLVSGIFGMNVGGIPGVPGEGMTADWGFAMAMGLIVASVVGVLAALRWARLL